MRLKVLILLMFCFTTSFAQIAKDALASENNRNKPELEEWLKDAGFGLMMHWSVDSQLGTVISHTIVGSSEDYQKRYYEELPKTFNPHKFNAIDIARLAKLSGAKYMVLTTKHHSGFCMWDTKTTEFNIMNTPYGKDIVKQYVEACREVGLKVGFYYSPEDWLFLRKKGALIKRRGRHDIAKPFRKEYDAFVVDQLKELLTNYGKIDIMFLDGGYWPPAKKACWDLQPDILITRGALNSPEQTVSDIARENAWEACITMNNQWAYKPTNKKIKHGTRIIEILIETRAKGGALALNIGPKPDGELDIVEEETFREVAAWNFVNYEAINGVRPWIVTNEKNIWLSRKGNTVYAYITKIDWERGERKEFLLNSIKATEKTKISVIGQNDIVCEYQYVVPKSKFEQTYAGLNISVVRAQRIYNANDWDNPIVVKIENVEPSFDPIQANLLELKTIRDKNDVISYSANIDTKIENLKIGVLYREYNGFHESIYADKWEKVEAVSYKGGQTFTNMIKNLNVNKDYQMRLYVIQNGVQIDGKIVKVRRKK